MIVAFFLEKEFLDRRLSSKGDNSKQKVCFQGFDCAFSVCMRVLHMLKTVHLFTFQKGFKNEQQHDSLLSFF